MPLLQDFKKAIKTISLYEWKEDMNPQFILMMGLPASGKSTFIKTMLPALYPRIKTPAGLSTINSDAQLRGVQFAKSQEDYINLKNLWDKGNLSLLDKVLTGMAYKNYEGKIVEFPFTVNTIEPILKDGTVFWNSTYKGYYASYFFERDKAQAATEKVKDEKIKVGNDLLVIDTTGVNVNKYLPWIQDAKAEGYTVSVVYVDTPVDYCIARDRYRGETEGRSVGETVIRDYANKMGKAFSKYKELVGKEGPVQRLIHVQWQGGILPTEGYFKIMLDKKPYATLKG